LIDDDKVDSFEFESPSEAKPQRFTPDEMKTCGACRRANPPTRAQCLYCGVDLPLTAAAQKSQPAAEAAPATPDSAEAYYLVLAPNQTSIPSQSLAEIETLLHVKTPELKTLFDRGRSVPVMKAAAPGEAAGLEDKLRALGIETYWFRDDGLDANVLPQRVRSLALSDDGLVANSVNGGRIATRWRDLLLMVAGRLLVNKVEVEERRRRGRTQPLDTRELFSDEAVLDVYATSIESGCRISSGSFDFSCLGSEKAMTAFENFTALRNLLRLRAPHAELDDSYLSLRPVLENVWPLEPQTRKGEWRRSGAGKVDVATVTTKDNEAQFNSYSRLCHRLKLRALEGGE
jgi:hypothetical protein